MTGYVIAHPDYPRVSRRFKRQLRQDLHYVSKFGIEHQAQFRGIDPQDLAKRLVGRITYLMCSEKEKALSLWKEFRHLLEFENENF